MTVMCCSWMIESIARLTCSSAIAHSRDTGELTAFSDVESNAEVASSSSKILGLLTSALAIEIRCL
jgi:hypothetical protein